MVLSILLFIFYAGENPVCQLCNYRTYAVHQLSFLDRLDAICITEESVQFAEATVLKKKMYYNMRIKVCLLLDVKS